MLLTPEFSVSQTDSHVQITIRAPFAKIQETEISADGCDFYFYSRPYHLHLNLPGPVVNTEQLNSNEENNNKNNSATPSGQVKYEVDRQSFEVTLEKLEHGQLFEGLGLITNLLASSPLLAQETGNNNNKRRQLIEEIETRDGASGKSPSSSSQHLEIPPHFDWTLDRRRHHNDQEQFDYDSDDDEEEENEEQISVILPGATKHGFANQYSDENGRFSKIQEAFPDIVDFKQLIIDFPLNKRFRVKHSGETEHFSQDHYLANLFDTDDRDYIESTLIAWEQPSDAKALSPEDKKDMVERLKNRNFLLDFDDMVSAFLGLVDILFAYCYDLRINQGEHCAESSWNICKISGTFSWFCEFPSLSHVQISSFRRSLTYPLFRNFKLAQKCWADTVDILIAGREACLHVLLDIRRIFSVFDSSSSPKYILNDLYVHDYCVWIQKIRKEDLESLAQACQKLVETPNLKRSIGLDLEAIEDAGLLVVSEENPEDYEMLREICSNGRNSDENLGISLENLKIC